MMLRAKQVLMMITLLLCLVAFPVFAQEAGSTAAAADSSGATGITTLVILFGLASMFAVGGMLYMKEHSNKEVD